MVFEAPWLRPFDLYLYSTARYGSWLQCREQYNSSNISTTVFHFLLSLFPLLFLATSDLRFLEPKIPQSPSFPKAFFFLDL